MHAARCAVVVGLLGATSCARIEPGASASTPRSSAIETPLSAVEGATRVEAPPAYEPRLGWPSDGRIAGLYAHIGMIGAPTFLRFLDRVAASGMNAVVIDGKDYSGWLTYPSTIPLALQVHSQSHAVLHSLRDLVHAAHSRGVRVLLRIACFHDPWMAQHRPDMAIKGMSDWIDPHSAATRDYLLAVVDETLATGVDEIQLDYVRYPTEGTTHAQFQLGGTTTMAVITGFVKQVHEHTRAADVPLSLDVFGVVAWQREVDVHATGQDLSKLGALVEALSPMVYPSHFQKGFNGYSEPGDHPEVVGFGAKVAADLLHRVGSTAVVRPWIQAFNWHSAGYGSSYVAGEIAQAKAAGGNGWLAWNAGGFYEETFVASAQQRPPVDSEAK